MVLRWFFGQDQLLGKWTATVDQAFLAFYVMELLFKALAFERSLLCGACSVVWWNWLDLVIVLSGLIAARKALKKG